MYRNFLKRVIDILGALFLLILTSPIIIATAIFIYFKVSRDVIFTQARPGLNEKIFKIYKCSSQIVKFRFCRIGY